MRDYERLLEAEVIRLSRRSMLPVWLFAFVGLLLGGIGLLEFYFPHRAVTFVAGEIR